MSSHPWPSGPIVVDVVDVVVVVGTHVVCGATVVDVVVVVAGATVAAGATVVVTATDVAGGAVVGAASVVEGADEAGAVVDVALSRPPVSPATDEVAPVVDPSVELVDCTSVDSEPGSCGTWVDGAPFEASCVSTTSVVTGLTSLVAGADGTELVGRAVAS